MKQIPDEVLDKTHGFEAEAPDLRIPTEEEVKLNLGDDSVHLPALDIKDSSFTDPELEVPL